MERTARFDRRQFLVRLALVGAGAAVAATVCNLPPEKKNTNRAISLEPLDFTEEDTPEARITYAKSYLNKFVKRCEMYPQDQPENSIAQYNANVEGTFPVYIFDTEEGSLKITDLVDLLRIHTEINAETGDSYAKVEAKTDAQNPRKAQVAPAPQIVGGELGWNGYKIIVDTNAKSDAELAVRILDGFIIALQDYSIMQLIAANPDMVNQIINEPGTKYNQLRNQVFAEQNAISLQAAGLDADARFDTKRSQKNLLLILFIQHASKLNQQDKKSYILPSTNEEYTRLISKFNETRSGLDPEWIAAHPL